MKTKRGLKIHIASCSSAHGLTEEEFEIKTINAAFGTPTHHLTAGKPNAPPDHGKFIPIKCSNKNYTDNTISYHH